MMYTLSWQEKPPAIVVKIHGDFYPVSSTAPIVESFRKEFGFENFFGDLNNFGFDNALQYSKGRLIAQLPEIRQWLDEDCPYCKGTGDVWPELEERKCFVCRGTGKKLVMDWKSAYAVSASLNIFFRLFFDLAENQLLTVKLITQKNANNCAIGGEFSPALCGWLDRFTGSRNLLPVTHAIKLAYRHMLGSLSDFEKYKLVARIENRWLTIECPGDACGIYTEQRRKKFSSHNVDTPAQQLTLLSGLVALCDLVQKSLD